MGPQGEKARFLATVDNGAMINAIDTAAYQRIARRLSPLSPSIRTLRMADGSLVPSTGVWTGTLVWGPIEILTTFEVFPSGGSWRMLIGKPLLEQVRAVHDYSLDTITLPHQDSLHRIPNFTTYRPFPVPCLPTAVKFPSASTFTLPQTANNSLLTTESPKEQAEIISDVQHIDEAEDNKPLLGEVPDLSDSTLPNDIFTRLTTRGPFYQPRVDAIVEAVRFGSHLNQEQSLQVRELVKEFADVFALSIREVKPVNFIKFRLQIPQDAVFSKKVQQRPLTKPQREYLFPVLDDMRRAGITRFISSDEVKAVASTVLVQKTHSGTSLTLDDIRQIINQQCASLGEPLEHRIDTDSPPVNRSELIDPSKVKWRICQNFKDVNRVSDVATTPQGDIAAKQQRLAGHEFICVLDFAAGFYAIPVEEESQPYLCFYTEGRGYEAYQRMPMGVQGAPSCFSDLTANALHDIMMQLLLELYVDDGAMAGNIFEELLARLRLFFLRCRERGLSISPSKTQLFMKEVVFGGSRVGQEGIRPDLAKIAAVAEWPVPKNLLELMRFLGLTGYFRSLIKDYARLAVPLTDLLRNLDLPTPSMKGGKRKHRQYLRERDLSKYWEQRHTKAFLKLKQILVSEPVLRAPKFDGTPFIITSDGCKDGFGAVLAQRFTTQQPSGDTITTIHPIGFASKRTSPTEERYKPYLLEFAALKFAFDQFGATVWGFPVEIETDCIALRDTLTNDKLSVVHARWRDGILAYQVTAVRHRPGTTNVAADALSRCMSGRPRAEGDGSAWSVSEDWESAHGLVNDLLLVQLTDSMVSDLRERFAQEPLFLEVIEALQDLDGDKPERERHRARHRALGYMIDEGRLWKIADGKSTRARAKLECVSQKEATELARQIHADNGHWGRDLTKLQLMDRIVSPRLDQSIVKALLECPQCKNFGPTQLHALMIPITRRHPFELLVADYLALPKGKGGYHNVLLILDTYSQYVWGFKLKVHGTARTTVNGLESIAHTFRAPDTFMTDGGSHFDNGEVRTWCEAHGSKHHVVAAYAPWINGLVENANGKLLGRLKRLCSPNLGEDEYDDGNAQNMANSWPDHFDNAIRQLNERIIPAFKFSPKELMLGLVINTNPTPVKDATEELSTSEVNVHMAYVEQQRIDGADHTAKHTVRRKAVFDRRVNKSHAGEVIFETDQLVQVYANALDFTLASSRKLQPRWSAPRRVITRVGNSYTSANYKFGDNMSQQ